MKTPNNVHFCCLSLLKRVLLTIRHTYCLKTPTLFSKKVLILPHQLQSECSKLSTKQYLAPAIIETKKSICYSPAISNLLRWASRLVWDPLYSIWIFLWKSGMIYSRQPQWCEWSHNPLIEHSCGKPWYKGQHLNHRMHLFAFDVGDTYKMKTTWMVNLLRCTLPSETSLGWLLTWTIIRDSMYMV